MVPRFQLNININNQRQGKTVLSFLPVLAVLSVTWRGGGAEAVPSMRPASPLQPRHQQQPRPALVSSLTSPHQPPPAQHRGTILLHTRLLTITTY